VVPPTPQAQEEPSTSGMGQDSAPATVVREFKAFGGRVIEADGKLSGPEDQPDFWEGEKFEVGAGSRGAGCCFSSAVSLCQWSIDDGGAGARADPSTSTPLPPPPQTPPPHARAPRPPPPPGLWQGGRAVLPPHPGGAGGRLRRHRGAHLRGRRDGLHQDVRALRVVCGGEGGGCRFSGGGCWFRSGGGALVWLARGCLWPMLRQPARRTGRLLACRLGKGPRDL